jgi:type IV secretory pathway VirB2 component (pilin)
MSHVLLQRACLIDSKMSRSWAVSINTVKTFLRAIAEESPVLANIGAFCTVFRGGVTRLAADVAANIICGAAALVCRVR